jgi:hypothetical protein
VGGGGGGGGIRPNIEYVRVWVWALVPKKDKSCTFDSHLSILTASGNY